MAFGAQVLTVVPSVEGVSPEAAFVHPDGEGLSPRDRSRREWVAKIPVLRLGNRSIERTLRRSYDDLGALRIEDPMPTNYSATRHTIDLNETVRGFSAHPQTDS